MGTARDVPFLSGYVNDQAEMLSAGTVQALDRELHAFEDSTSNQVVVLTVTDLGGEGLEEFSCRVARTWRLGQKGKDNGVLLLVSRDDRKVRIEVGTGLEGDLTDVTCGLIIRSRILPRFRNADFDGGVLDGVHAILDAIRGSFSPAADPDGPRGIF